MPLVSQSVEKKLKTDLMEGFGSCSEDTVLSCMTAFKSDRKSTLFNLQLVTLKTLCSK